MRDIGLSLLFLWIIILHLGSCNYAEILWGQCYTFCLNRSEIQQKDDESVVQVKSDKLIQACKKHQACKWCLFACDRPATDYENHDNCLNDCNSQKGRQSKRANKACIDSCNVISTFLQGKFGSCPQPGIITVPGQSCEDECHKDLHCSGIKKCCQNYCATCSDPVESKVIPQFPLHLTFKETEDGSLLIEWQGTTSPIVVTPILYILRWWCPGSPAAEFKFTTKAQVKLKGYPVIHPGHKCNFMLAAINVHGSEGFTLPRTYTKKFLKPSQPQNLMHVKNKVFDRTVDMTIAWLPPVYTDGQNVTNYMISWSDGLPRGQSDYMRLHMHRKTIKGDRNSFTIQKLNLCTVYFVQVQAVVKWDQTVVRGHPASVYIEACVGPQPADIEVETVSHMDPEKTYLIYNLTIHEAEFVGSDLKANVTWSLFPGSNVKYFKVFWKLDVCEGESAHRKTRDRIQFENRTESRFLTLYNLLSDCIYEVKVHTVNFTGKLDEGSKEIFRTPPCLSTKGMVAKQHCLEEVSPPLPPISLEVGYKKMSCMCQAVLRWKVSPEGDSRIKQYIVMWGQSRPPVNNNHAVSPVIYNSQPFKINVPKEDFKACLTYLERSKHYTVQVISQTARAKSAPAIYHFETPGTMSLCYGGSSGEVLNEDTSTNYFFDAEVQVEVMANTTAPPSDGSSSTSAVSKHVFCLQILLLFAVVEILKN